MAAEQRQTPHIKVESYSRKTPKQTMLLQNVSFELPRGKMTVLIGLSGDGKSMLMDSVAGTCAANHTTYGTIQVGTSEGLVDRDPCQWRKSVSYSSQSGPDYGNIPLESLLRDSAVFNNVPLGKVAQYMKVFKLTKSAAVAYKHLSGGEQKRTQIVIGLLKQKGLNIWDEPLTGLDSVMAKTVLETMKAAKVTQLASIHQISGPFLEVFDNLVLMYTATVVYHGPIKELASFMKKLEIAPRETDVDNINYLLMLSSIAHAESEEDRENMQLLKHYAESILCRPVSAQASKNVAFVRPTWPSFRTAVTIWRRSMYFDKYFTGYLYIRELFFYTLLILIRLGFFRMFANHTTGLLNLENPNTLSFKFLTSESAKGLMDETLRKKAIRCFNYLGLVTVNQDIWTLGVYIFWISIVFGTRVTGTRNQKLCRENIQEGEFAPTSLLLAQVLENLVTKGLVPFVAFLASIALSVAMGDVSMGDSPGFIVPLYCVGALLAALCVFMYHTFWQCVSFHSKLKVLASMLLITIPHTFICVFYLTILTSPSMFPLHPYNSMAGVLSRGYTTVSNGGQTVFGPENLAKEKDFMSMILFSILVPLCIKLVEWQPPMVIPYLYLYTGAYLGYFLPSLPTTEALTGGVLPEEFQNLNQELQKHLLGASSHGHLVSYLNPDTQSLTLPFGFFSFIWRFGSLLFLPFLFMAGAVALRHVSIQPKLR
ncbi:hypothetical protein NEDG_02140 [Nematocida displodere]|uniref:ABC transporter domain-containing protein n=1 Tax=Nematocida displodere TaxID=1805483 RepID=A0A177ED67_9MICR|nr:hypothetical protein NEDG_01450 [Nematocida displodere]OAG32273.1 hypothetical protein NEDG_02140 [Nematocida displodere]